MAVISILDTGNTCEIQDKIYFTTRTGFRGAEEYFVEPEWLFVELGKMIRSTWKAFKKMSKIFHMRVMSKYLDTITVFCNGPQFLRQECYDRWANEPLHLVSIRWERISLRA